MSREHNGAEGQMNLYFDFYESASGHVENGRSINLKAKDENIIQLVEEKWNSEIFKNSRNSKNTDIYEISVDELISLIKERGSKIE